MSAWSSSDERWVMLSNYSPSFSICLSCELAVLAVPAKCSSAPSPWLLFCEPQHCGDDSGEAGADVLFGLEFLPLKPCDVITMVTDTFRGTLRYLVNGVDAGIAFGPPESGAACILSAREAPFSWNGGAVLFPSCSLTNEKQVHTCVTWYTRT